MLDVCKCVASKLDRFTSSRTAPTKYTGHVLVGWVPDRFWTLWNRKYFCPDWGSNSYPPVVQPVAQDTFKLIAFYFNPVRCAPLVTASDVDSRLRSSCVILADEYLLTFWTVVVPFSVNWSTSMKAIWTFGKPKSFCQQQGFTPHKTWVVSNTAMGNSK